jgi:subtilase family serine protease
LTAGCRFSLTNPEIESGAGQSIAIVNAYDDPNAASNLRAFDVKYGLPDPILTKINETGGSSLPSAASVEDGWATQADLEIQIAHTMAPKANIVVVEANSAATVDLVHAVDTARKWPGVSVVLIGWGGTEFAGQTNYDSYFTTPPGHANNVAFVASTSNQGQSSGPSWPATSPNVISVGGTSLAIDPNNRPTMSKVWAGGGGGVSAYEPALSFQSSFPHKYPNRATPDLAADADPDTAPLIYTNGKWTQVGGTGMAAAIIAGIIADINSYYTATQGRPVTLSTNDFLTTVYTRNTGKPLNVENVVDITGCAEVSSMFWNSCTGLGTPYSLNPPLTK